MKHNYLIYVLAMLLYGSIVHAQIPVECMAGETKTTIDVMFFKYFTHIDGSASHWLFFNRNRAAADYRMSSTTYQPQFGFTEAISYNHPTLKGIAPVMVAQVLNTGVYTKSGVQYAHVRPAFTLFTWLVSELKQQPALDCFLLLRYTPTLTTRTQLFTQAEVLNTLPFNGNSPYSFTQRVRLGVQLSRYQLGAALDASQNGRGILVQQHNAGLFLRHEF